MRNLHILLSICNQCIVLIPFAIYDTWVDFTFCALCSIYGPLSVLFFIYFIFLQWHMGNNK